MNTAKIKETAKKTAPYNGSAFRMVAMGIASILVSTDIIKESNVEQITGALTIVIAGIWQLYAHHKALKAQPEGDK